MAFAHDILRLLMEAHSYAVVSVRLPDSISTHIRDIKSRIPRKYIADEDEDQDLDPHVTLFYGLKDSDYSLLKESLSLYGKPLHYTVKSEFKVFPGKNEAYKVLVLPVESTCFQKVHNIIKNVTGTEPPTFKTYKPHATVAFVKKQSPEDYSIPFDTFTGSTNSVDFYTTQDKCYPIFLIGKSHE